MVNVEALKKRYGITKVPGRGRCIVVPSKEFEPDWDQELLDLGFEAHGIGERTFITKVKGEMELVKVEAKKEPVAPTKAKKVKGPHWTRKEDSLLIQIWNQIDLSTAQVCERYLEAVVESKLTKRTVHAIENRIGRLREKGKIKTRFQLRREAKETKAPPKLKLEKVEQPPGDTFEMVAQILRRFDCRILMQRLEIRELQGVLIIPSNLKTLYANALLKSDEALVDLFRKETKQFLDLYKKTGLRDEETQT